MVRRQGDQRVSAYFGCVVALILALLLGVGVLAASQPGRAAVTTFQQASADAGVAGETCLAMTGGVTYTVLQDAIDAAGALGSVYVANGTCYETLSIARSVTLTGGWSRAFPALRPDPGSASIIDALGAGRVISISKPAASPTDVVVKLAGLTLTGGDATGLGGGTGAVDVGGAVYAQGVDLTIRNCIITDSVATSTSSRTGWGGGIGTYLCDSVLLESNTLANNVAGADGPGNGGAFADYRSRSVALQGNVIEGNVASVSDTGNGGGVWVSNVGATPQDRILLQGNAILRNAATGNGTGHGGGLFSAGVEGLLIEGDLYQGNEAAVKGTGYGGAVALDGGRVTLTAPWFAANVATTGGGLWASGGNLTLARAYALGNEARDGGAVWLGGVSGGRIENTVIAENVIRLQGAGAGIVVSGGSAQLLHTTLALNSGGDGSGLLATGGASVWLTNTIAVSHTVAITAASGSSAVAAATLWGGEGWANGADLGGEATSVGPDVVGIPDFVAFAGRPYHIGRQSAALDAGIDAGVSEDIDGHVRPLGNGVDLGADEAVVIWLPLILRGDVVAGGD
mgnify:FL=1